MSRLYVMKAFRETYGEKYDCKMSICWVPYLMYVWQIFKLQENNRALDQLTKTKEAALLEAERTVIAAEAKASHVDDL